MFDICYVYVTYEMMWRTWLTNYVVVNKISKESYLGIFSGSFGWLFLSWWIYQHWKVIVFAWSKRIKKVILYITKTSIKHLEKLCVFGRMIVHIWVIRLLIAVLALLIPIYECTCTNDKSTIQYKTNIGGIYEYHSTGATVPLNATVVSQSIHSCFVAISHWEKS